MSRTKNNGIKINLFHFLTVISKKVARIVSTNIAPVTEIPYACDKFSEFLNPKINNTTPKNKKKIYFRQIHFTIFFIGCVFNS